MDSFQFDLCLNYCISSSSLQFPLYDYEFPVIHESTDHELSFYNL